MESTQKICLSEKGKKLEQFILIMPINVWYNTKKDEKIINIIKEWIDLDCMYPKYFLVFNPDYSKFKKSLYDLGKDLEPQKKEILFY